VVVSGLVLVQPYQAGSFGGMRNMKNSVYVLLAALLIAGGIQEVAHAQLTAQITGTITDGTGAVVPTAKITLNTAT